MSNKYSIGNKVVINRRCKRLPVWIKKSIRLHRIRTIGSIYYKQTTQHTRYYLGTNQRGDDISRYPFRAEMLKLYKIKLHAQRIKDRRKELVV